MQDVNAPRDRFNVVYMIMFWLGMGALLPWNFFINATEYFKYKLRDVSNPNSTTALQETFENYIGVTSMVPNVFFLFLSTALTRRISMNKRLVTGLSAMIAVFAFTQIMVEVETDSWQVAFFGLTLMGVFVQSAGSAVMQGALFGLASLLPSRYMQAVMSGQALGGIFASIAYVFSLMTGSSAISSGRSYFATAQAALILSLVAYFFLIRTDMIKYYRNKSTTSHKSEDKKAVMLAAMDDDKPESAPSNSISIVAAFKKCARHAIDVVLVFLVTLAVYPALTQSVQSINMNDGTEWSNIYFTPVSCFLIFNIGDLIGRFVSVYLAWPRANSILMPVFCVARLAFIPLFMMCNSQPRHYMPVVFNHDAYFIVLMALMSISNGYFASLCMIYGSRTASTEEQETVGSMMAFFLSLGLGLGSALSFGVVLLA